VSECSICFPQERAIKINADISEGKITQRAVAEKYGINYYTLRGHIRKGHTNLVPSTGHLGASGATEKIRAELLAGVTSIKHTVPQVIKIGPDDLSDNGPITHIMIPDTQVGPGVPIDHILWIAQYIVDHFYGRRIRIIIIGDWWDMPSLSSYDKGTKDYEGRRIIADFVAGNDAMAAFMKPLLDSRAKDEKKGKTPWWPLSLEFLDGNHEFRVERALQLSPELEGLIGLEFMDVEKYGFNRYPFLKVANFEGVNYSHYFQNNMTGRPYSGNNIETRLKTIGASFSQGHQQVHLTAIRYVMGQQQRGLVSGSCYIHDEKYRGFQGNEAHWRGIIVCNDVRNGGYELMEVSLDYLCRRYEGKSLKQFVSRKYPNLQPF
jgi:hypothetical protein